jgi:hypothetical protein
MNIMSILGVYRPMFGVVTQSGLRFRRQGEFQFCCLPRAKPDLGVHRKII